MEDYRGLKNSKLRVSANLKTGQTCVFLSPDCFPLMSGRKIAKLVYPDADNLLFLHLKTTLFDLCCTGPRAV